MSALPMSPVVVKVCCIASVAEARLAVAQGARVLGLVSAMPSGPGVITDDVAAEVAAWAAAQAHAQTQAPAPETFLLTSRTTAEGIAEQHRRVRSTALQLVDELPPAELQALRALCPGVRLVQVVHVLGEASVAQALAAAPLVDALLLDSGNPHLAVKELGGTGRTHDWATSRRIRDAVAPLPLFLAGGLHAGNVAEALATVRPHGLDLCSRVRQAGTLHSGLLADFMAAVRAA